MAKVLRKYTTIPSHLYVKRYADTQIKEIIEEMDRPGYVLVARQMGKTNLLFNAKRELQNEDTIIPYIDLSNVFDNERDCYRNIIDIIRDSAIEKFSAVSEEIEITRSNSEIAPHKEYSQELRKLLKSHNGKIVIILDEIDALRSAPYSDKIFAQIRSNYFARTNYPEFENLTYILSGVIEPTELIKDRNKSPFNIGEKIYLDDFTYEEHLEFIAKSKLDVNSEIIQEVYNWTSGNPRLTFDLCAEIEDYIIKNGQVKKDKIEELVHKKYLTTYDIAPIDHIRELVINNATVRNAISNIRKNSSSISSEVKSKLYLFGIINSDFNNVTIKNKIIDLSLSEEWIKSIERQTKSLFEIGSESIMNKTDIEGGIESLKEYLDSDLNIPNAQRQLSHYYIGYGYHTLFNFKESNDYLLVQIVSCDISTDLHYRQKLFIGLNFLSLKDFERGEEYLNDIINNYKNTPPYLNALLNLSSSLLERGFEANKERSKNLLNSIIDNADYVEIDTSDRLTINEFKAVSYYYLAQIASRESDFDVSLGLIDKALIVADNQYIPELLFSKYLLQNEKDLNLLTEIYTIIQSTNLKLTKQIFEISFSRRNLFKYLLTTFEVFNELFEKLFNYTLSYIFEGKIKEIELYFEIANFAHLTQTKISLFEKILEVKNEEINDTLLLETYRNLAELNLGDDKLFLNYFNEYLHIFEDDKINAEAKDITTFAIGIKFYSDRNELIKGVQLCNIISDRVKRLDSTLEFESLMIYYWYTNLYFSLNQNDKAIEYSNLTIDIIDRYKEHKKKLSFLDEKGIATVYSQMQQIRNSLITRKPIIIEKKYGRNDIVKVKYIDGREVCSKYKKIEADLLAERCKIIG